MEGKVLAVDPGSRRVGLALSDEARLLASPLRTLEAEAASIDGEEFNRIWSCSKMTTTS